MLQEFLNETHTPVAEAEATKADVRADRSIEVFSHLRARFGTARERFPDAYEGMGRQRGSLATHPEEGVRENAGQSLSVVMIYNDLHAAVRAVEAVERLSCKYRGRARQQLLPAPISQLLDPLCFGRLLNDANSADMLIVSFNGSGSFPAILKTWIEECFRQKRAGPSAIVVWLSSHERLEAPDSPRYQFLKNAPCSAGLDFFPVKPNAV